MREVCPVVRSASLLHCLLSSPLQVVRFFIRQKQKENDFFNNFYVVFLGNLPFLRWEKRRAPPILEIDIDLPTSINEGIFLYFIIKYVFAKYCF